MTADQQPPFTIEELGAKFGVQLSQAYAELITLEKVIVSQRAKIEAMIQNEMEMTARIHEIEIELVELRAATKEVVNPHALSEAAAEIAAEGKAIIDGGGKEKAAPVEAA